MKLTYRGIAYKLNPPVIEAVATQRQGVFLGNRFNFKLFEVAQRDLKLVQLRYRGVAYKAFVPEYKAEIQCLPVKELDLIRAQLDSAYQG